MEDKILNIKIKGEDFEKIEIIILNYIANLQNNVKENNLEEVDELNFEIFKCKLLLAKLDTCKNYN